MSVQPVDFPFSHVRAFCEEIEYGGVWYHHRDPHGMIDIRSEEHLRELIADRTLIPAQVQDRYRP